MTDLGAYVGRGGCACKIESSLLEELLQSVSMPYQTDSVLVGMKHADDAGIYRLTEEIALVQTVDFFTPIVEDPFLYGQIAATNSLSDVYAMGGTPITAMQIVAFPLSLVKNGTLERVLQGAAHVLRNAKVSLLGGHSIEDEIPKFGLSVTGLVDPNKVWSNAGAIPGDVLILTKPLGVGVLSVARRAALFPEGVEEATRWMITLNEDAAKIGRRYTIHSCTDVTGFSLLGHASEMAKASGVSFIMGAKEWPLIKEAKEAAMMGLVPAASYGNRKAVGVDFEEGIPEWMVDIGYDPQTSGGLLFSVPEKESDALIQELVQAGLEKAAIIGRVVEKGENLIDVHKSYLC